MRQDQDMITELKQLREDPEDDRNKIEQGIYKRALEYLRSSAVELEVSFVMT